MYDITTGRSAATAGFSRRSFLRVGGLAPLGLSLPDLLAAEAAGGPAARARSVILVFLGGAAGVFAEQQAGGERAVQRGDGQAIHEADHEVKEGADAEDHRHLLHPQCHRHRR